MSLAEDRVAALVASSWRRRRLIACAVAALESLIGDGFEDRSGLCGRTVAELRRFERGVLQ
jgi:hypothetical protein